MTNIYQTTDFVGGYNNTVSPEEALPQYSTMDVRVRIGDFAATVSQQHFSDVSTLPTLIFPLTERYLTIISSARLLIVYSLGESAC